MKRICPYFSVKPSLRLIFFGKPIFRLFNFFDFLGLFDFLTFLNFISHDNVIDLIMKITGKIILT